MHFNNRVLVWATFASLCFFAGSLGNVTNVTVARNDDDFYYFAYGSNMFDKRIHLNNPTAEFYTIAVLKDYRLDFNISVPFWKGAVATICNEPGDSVWGVLWVMQQSDRENLDKQEGVRLGMYFPDYVTVKTINGKELTALVYQQYYQPRKLSNWKDLPKERRPSITYINVMITGAVQAGLPLQYSKMLCSIPHNNEHADPSLLKQLGRSFNESKLTNEIGI